MVQVIRLKSKGREEGPLLADPLRKNRQHYELHLRETTATLNASFRAHNMPIVVECEHLFAEDEFDRLIDGEHGQHILNFMDRIAAGRKAPGMMHDTQINTAVEIFSRIYRDPGRSVLCLGAMMCGKTGTANATHLLGPVFFLLTGVKYYPIQLLPVRRASGSQTQQESMTWNALYQHLRIRHVERQTVDCAFSREGPTYFDYVVKIFLIEFNLLV